MAIEDILLRLRLAGQTAVKNGLHDVAQAERQVGTAAVTSSAQTQKSAGKTKSAIASVAASAKAAAPAAAAVAGVFALDFLGDSVKEARAAQVSQAKLMAQLKASGISYEKYGAQIDKVIQKTSKLAALDDEDLQDAFTNIVRATGDVTKSMRLVGLAADVARAKNLDVAKAGEIVGKVAGGNTGILSRYGIQIKKGATATEALAEMQKRFGGQAEKYGKTSQGAYDRLGVTFGNLKETVGGGLTPALTAAARGLDGFLRGVQSGTGVGGVFAGMVRNTLAPVFNTLGGAVRTVSALFRGDFKGALNGVKQMFGGLGEKLAGPFWMLRRVAQGAFSFVVGQAGKLIGTASGIGSAIGGLLGSLIKAPVNAVISAINAIPDIKIPKISLGKLGSIGGGTIGIPQIQPLAAGTASATPGVKLVGEQGPELIRLRGGEQVNDAATTAGLLGGRRFLRLEVPVMLKGRELGRAVIDDLDLDEAFT